MMGAHSLLRNLKEIIYHPIKPSALQLRYCKFFLDKGGESGKIQY
jgi:hypothetical protein